MARPIHQSEDGIAPRLRLIDFPAANHFLRIPNHQRLLLELAWFDDGKSISRHFCLFWGLLELDLRCPLHQNGILKCIFIDISAGLNSSLGAKLSYEFLVFFSIEYKSYESCGAVYNEACWFQTFEDIQRLYWAGGSQFNQETNRKEKQKQEHSSCIQIQYLSCVLAVFKACAIQTTILKTWQFLCFDDVIKNDKMIICIIL